MEDEISERNMKSTYKFQLIHLQKQIGLTWLIMIENTENNPHRLRFLVTDYK